MNQVATKLDRPRDGYFQFSWQSFLSRISVCPAEVKLTDKSLAAPIESALDPVHEDMMKYIKNFSTRYPQRTTQATTLSSSRTYRSGSFPRKCLPPVHLKFEGDRGLLTCSHECRISTFHIQGQLPHKDCGYPVVRWDAVGSFLATSSHRGNLGEIWDLLT